MSDVQAGLALPVDERAANYKYFNLNGAGAVQLGFSCILHGYTLANASSSATATLNMYDGTDTTGQAIIPISFAASESVGDWFDRGIWLRNGLYVNLASGQVSGAIYYRHWRL